MLAEAARLAAEATRLATETEQRLVADASTANLTLDQHIDAAAAAELEAEPHDEDANEKMRV